MQPITIQSIVQIVFIVWFGIQMLMPVFTTGGDDDN